MFSILMCVYEGDTADFFWRAVRSITVEQSRPPVEIILVIDGPISPMLHERVEEARDLLPKTLKIIPLPKNVGHGKARQAGLMECSSDWVAIMDSDDISLPDRLATLEDTISKNPDVSVIGTSITEFLVLEHEERKGATRHFPESHEAVLERLPWRSPIAQPSVCFRKSAVKSVGGYLHWHNNEDYYLWTRLAEAGFKFRNIPDVTVLFRVARGTYLRRGGWQYWKSEAKMQLYIFRSSVSGGVLPLIVGVSGRFVMQVLMPRSLRAKIYNWLLR